MLNKYYVYALIDPRDNQIFYIGKGSGSRYKSHANTKRRSDINIKKHLRIMAIIDDGLEVLTEVLYPYLSEEDAFQLEMIMIYKLGREAFCEGSLCNFAPGGQWKPGDSVLFDDNFSLEFDYNRLDFVARERFLSFKTISDFSYLGGSIENQKIYVYNFDGQLLLADSIRCWFKNHPPYDIYGVFQELVKEDYPIADYNNIYSKSPILNLYCSHKIPFPNLHFINADFCRRFDSLLTKGEDFEIDFKEKGVLRLEASKKSHDIVFKSFYKSGNKKYYKLVNEVTKNNEFIEWNEDGTPIDNARFFNGVADYHTFHDNGKVKTSFVSGADKKLSETYTYYENGNLQKQVIYRNEERIKSVTVWFDTGELNYQYNNFDKPFKYELWDKTGMIVEIYNYVEGYINYNPDGSLKGKYKEKQSAFVDDFDILKPHSYSGVKSKEDEVMEIQQRKQADEDWCNSNGSKSRNQKK